MAGIGYRTGIIWDAARKHWRNDADRPIAWSAWYPTADTGPLLSKADQFFDPGQVIPNAAVLADAALPVVMLSHGTGGTAETLGWLARALAQAGYLVIGANHHGNTSQEPYLAEGFLCWWERAADISVLLTSIASMGPFVGQIDLNRVFAVGFSLGGYTALALAGARTSMAVFETWRETNGITSGGPKEFPAAEDQIPSLLKTSDTFRRSWGRQSDTYTDQRIQAVVAIAPAPPVRGFIAETVASIQTPTTLLSGGADQEAPPAQCVDWLAAQNPHFETYNLGDRVGHYTLLGLPTDKSRVGKVDILTDHPSVDRIAVHHRVIRRVLGTIGQNSAYSASSSSSSS